MRPARLLDHAGEPPRRALRATLALVIFAGCAHAARPTPEHPQLTGRASFYAQSLAGHRTASGEPYRPLALTCAHRSLPLGSRVRVTALRSGRTVELRVNDRGPYAQGRILDLSTGAARALEVAPEGDIPVGVEVLGL